jgi:TIGR03009 family protein
MLRLGWCFVLALVLAEPAWGQTHPLRGPAPSGDAVEPDQPVQPQLPTLVPRAPQQSVAPSGPSQPPPPPFTLTPQEEAKVDRVLNQWEERNRNTKTFDCRFKRWMYDVVFGSASQAKFVDIGVIKYAAPDRGMFRVEATEKDGKETPIEDARTEHWISDGKSIFEFSPAKKQLIEHKLPPDLQGKAIADGPLPFLFGTEAQKLKQRYWIRNITPSDVQDRIWLEAYPRFQQDKANFHHAHFIITVPGMSPFALRLYQPNEKDYTVYQFYDVVVNDPFRLFKGDPFRAFTPLGWQKLVEEPPAAQAGRPVSDDRR